MPAKSAMGSGPPQARVLIVEDDARLRAMLTRAIGEIGFAPEAVGDAERALAMLEQLPSDVLLADLRLPGMDGLSLCESARRRWPRMQFIILTGHGDLEAARRAIRVEAADFLTKPCPLDDLRSALERAMRRHEGLARADAGKGDAPPEARRLQDIEREHILGALERHGGSRTEAARELGISVRTLYYRLSEYESQGHYKR